MHPEARRRLANHGDRQLVRARGILYNEHDLDASLWKLARGLDGTWMLQWFEDAKSIAERDPAATGPWQVVFQYPGFKAIRLHRLANWLHRHGRRFMARAVSQHARHRTGIEIHPGATIGNRVFIDHGMGVVIGETAEIGDDCTIYQAVTIGGTGKHCGKRHPTIGANVLIGAGAKILGPFTVGDNAKIAANAVVLDEVDEDTTVVGVPARAVRKGDHKIRSSYELDQIHMGDPVSQDFCRMRTELQRLRDELLACEDVVTGIKERSDENGCPKRLRRIQAGEPCPRETAEGKPCPRQVDTEHPCPYETVENSEEEAP
jgi:serine O-acetyltransferase